MGMDTVPPSNEATSRRSNPAFGSPKFRTRRQYSGTRRICVVSVALEPADSICVRRLREMPPRDRARPSIGTIADSSDASLAEMLSGHYKTELIRR